MGMSNQTEPLPALTPCSVHSSCAIDPLNGDHVDTNTGTRAPSIFDIGYSILSRVRTSYEREMRAYLTGEKGGAR